MKKLTRKQKIFLILYPFIHWFVLWLSYMILLDVEWSRAQGRHPTVQSEIINAVVGFFFCLLEGPQHLLGFLFGGDCWWTNDFLPFLIWIACGFIILYMYKFLSKR